MFPDDAGRGGLALLGGYLRNLRAARAADGGAVLLLDAGDTFESGIASNISEGALVVDAYNALGYDALAVGNHEFDYGAIDTASAEPGGPPDMRGALKAAAARARFPFLAANLIDAATRRPVEWPNVRSSTLVDAAGLRVGIVGVMTRYGLTRTLAANVQGLETTALEPTVEREARRLRRRGADLVLVLAQRRRRLLPVRRSRRPVVVRRRCRDLPVGPAAAARSRRRDSSPDTPTGRWRTRWRAFRSCRPTRAGARSRASISPSSAAPAPCPRGSSRPRRSAPPSPRTGGPAQPTAANRSSYEGVLIEPDASVVTAMQPVLEQVNRWRAEPLGITLETPLPRNPDGIESPLGNLFADAILAAVPGADLAIGMGGRRAGLRRDLPAGPLTRGPLYDVFAFDNRVVTLVMTGAQVQQALARELTRELARSLRGIPSLSGFRVRVTCAGVRRRLEIVRPSGAPIGREETLVVATTDFFARRAALDSIVTPPPAALASAPLVRVAVASWLTARGGRLGAADLVTPPRWEATEGGACLARRAR